MRADPALGKEPFGWEGTPRRGLNVEGCESRPRAAHTSRQRGFLLRASLLPGLTLLGCWCLQDKVGIQTWTCQT